MPLSDKNYVAKWIRDEGWEVISEGLSREEAVVLANDNAKNDTDVVYTVVDENELPHYQNHKENYKRATLR